jgi:hypothetical protein
MFLLIMALRSSLAAAAQAFKEEQNSEAISLIAPKKVKVVG